MVTAHSRDRDLNLQQIFKFSNSSVESAVRSSATVTMEHANIVTTCNRKKKSSFQGLANATTYRGVWEKRRGVGAFLGIRKRVAFWNFEFI